MTSADSTRASEGVAEAGDGGLRTVCPTCGPTTAEQHPRRSDVTRCGNCKEWLAAHPATPPAEHAESDGLSEDEVGTIERSVCTLGKVECKVLDHNHARHLNRLVPAVERIVDSHVAAATVKARQEGAVEALREAADDYAALRETPFEQRGPGWPFRLHLDIGDGTATWLRDRADVIARGDA